MATTKVKIVCSFDTKDFFIFHCDRIVFKGRIVPLIPVEERLLEVKDSAGSLIARLARLLVNSIR